tara:strand:- start:1581 stop:2186 length:606 start_codon:yes stop_codon:yes gene_type:complete
MYHIIFSYNPDIIKLGKATVTNSGGNFVNSYWQTDDPKYIDWSTKKLKLGDKVKYYNSDKVKTDIGTINASTGASRVTLATTITDAVIDDFKAEQYNVFVERDYNSDIQRVYSYPINKFVGSCSYSTSILSLFFERTSGMIDEVRLNIKDYQHMSAIEELNKEFREERNNDIIVRGDGFSRSTGYIQGVNKVLTSISSGRK